MSESNKNVTTSSSKIRAKISDVSLSSQHPKSRSDMSASFRSLKDTRTKAEAEDVIFDSGIQSESNLSGIISETDIVNVSTDCEISSRTLSKETLDVAKADISSDIYKSEVTDSMRLDSGIDIDESDQFSGSKLDTCHSGEILSTECDDAKTTNNRLHSKNPVSPNDVNYWELFFEPDDDGNTQLHLAIIQGYEAYVLRILQHIPDSCYLDIRNYYRQTSLHLSVLLNQPKITRYLLLAGARTGTEDRNGNTALHLACKMNNLECVKALLNPVTVYEQKYTIFKYKPVIDVPGDYINEYNYDGLSCIHLAAVHPDMKVLHQLFLYGGDVNIRECKAGYTILHSAVRSGNYNLVNYILQHSGIDVERKNYARLTPYQLSFYHPRIAKILLEKGASRLLMVDDESDEDDYSSDESDSEDELFDDSRAGSSRINQVTNMMYSLNTNDVVSPT